MNGNAKLAAVMVLALAIMLGSAHRGLAQEAPNLIDDNVPVYASAQDYELQPSTPRASVTVRRPSMQTLYEAIGKAYGIVFVFERELRLGNLRSDYSIDDATLQEAIAAAEAISATFVTPLDEHTGLVVADTAAKRGEYERQVLTYLHADSQTTPQQLTEIGTALRTFLDLRRVTTDSRLNVITVRGRTKQVKLAHDFFASLQKPPGEVMLEVEIWEIDTRKARELGILPPQSFELRFLGRSLSGTVSNLFGVGRGQSLFGMALPSALLQATFNSSLLRSHQTMQLRASHGLEASMSLGQRFPLEVGSISTGVPDDNSAAQSGLAYAPSIQYEDLGVIAKVTPYLHSGREVTLAINLAVRDLGAQELGGKPTIVNRELIGQIRLKEGESYLVTGIRNKTALQSKTGTPWIARLPIVGALFGTRKKDNLETEVWLLIRPYILRSSPAELFASRTLLFGKELTGLPAAPAEPATTPQPQPGGAAPGGQPGVPGQPPVVVPGQPGILPQGFGQPIRPGTPGAFPGGIPQGIPVPGQPGTRFGIPGVPAPQTPPAQGTPEEPDAEPQ